LPCVLLLYPSMLVVLLCDEYCESVMVGGDAGGDGGDGVGIGGYGDVGVGGYVIGGVVVVVVCVVVDGGVSGVECCGAVSGDGC